MATRVEQKNNLLSFFYNYKFTILLYLSFCVINFMQFGIGFKAIHIYNFINNFIVLLIIYCCSRIRFKPLSYFFLFIVFIWICFDVSYSFIYRNSISKEVLSSILETNISEATSVMGMFVAPACIAIFVYSILLFWVPKEFKKSKLSTFKPLIIIVLYFLLYLPLLQVRHVRAVLEATDPNKNYPSAERIYKEICTFGIGGAQENLTHKTSLIIGDIITIAAYYEQMSSLSDYYTIKRKISDDVTFDTDAHSPEKIFLVLGESSSRNYYSLYGLPMQKRPLFSTLYLCLIQA